MGNATKILKKKLQSFFPILNKINGGCPSDIHPFAISLKLTLATVLLVLMSVGRVQAQCAISYSFKNPVLTSGTLPTFINTNRAVAKVNFNDIAKG